MVVWDSIKESDAVIHAGDVVEAFLLEEIAKIVPVHAVLGNNDPGLDLPTSLELSFEQVKLAVLHDAGARKGRPERLKRQFPDAQVVVYGHSHIPDCQTFEGLLIMNPGSCTDRRREPKFSFGRLAVEGSIVRPYIVRF